MKRLSALKKESVSNEMADSRWIALLARQVSTTPYRFNSFRGVEGALDRKGTLCFSWKKGYFEKKVRGNLSSPPPPRFLRPCLQLVEKRFYRAADGGQLQKC